ncbi:MAG: D-sedoheptulose 7-phosphate isomerase [Candidatus Firestonebacteria bacterium]
MIKKIEKELKEASKVILSTRKLKIIIAKVVDAIVDSYLNGGKVVLFGNGGSAADAQHIAAEFVVRFIKERKSLPALALTVNTSVLTASANDYGYKYVFSRQVESLVKPDDVVIGISTSGSSPNVIEALKKAKEIGAKTIGFTGKNKCPIEGIVDICIKIPSDKTYHIQEGHIVVLHLICKLAEDKL